MIDDDEPYWKRYHGIAPLTNEKAMVRFAVFFVCAVAGMLVLFGLLCLVFWLTA